MLYNQRSFNDKDQGSTSSLDIPTSLLHEQVAQFSVHDPFIFIPLLSKLTSQSKHIPFNARASLHLVFVFDRSRRSKIRAYKAVVSRIYSPNSSTFTPDKKYLQQ